MKWTKKDKERFFKKVRKLEGPNACHIWTGAVSNDGYGGFYFEGKTYKAHRLIFMVTHGIELDPNTLVRHLCGTKRCIRVEHLADGTHQDNMNDQVRNGALRGIKNGNAKINDFAVLKLRKWSAAGITNRDLSFYFGIKPGHVSDIITRKSWKHLDND